MIDPTEPPLSLDRLQRLRLALRKTVPSQTLGTHLRRKQGQSLQFRDYRAYQRGDDIRAVDWRASLRRGGDGDLIVKTFEAEERMTLVLIADVRPAMRLPQAAPKLIYALWALRCLAQVAAEAGDDVVFATLFGRQNANPLRARGRAVPDAARRFAREVWLADDPGLEAEPEARVDAIAALLKPASVVVLLSDMLFADTSGDVTRLAQAAQRNRRMLLVMEMDTLAMEYAAFALGGPVRLATVEGRAYGDTPRLFGNDIYDGLQTKVADHHNDLRRKWARGGLVWPDPVIWPVGLQRAALADVFNTTFPLSPLFRAVAARGGI
jgi:uncharacterized protein (DUF58 family)